MCWKKCNEIDVLAVAGGLYQEGILTAVIGDPCVGPGMIWAWSCSYRLTGEWSPKNGIIGFIVRGAVEQDRSGCD